MVTKRKDLQLIGWVYYECKELGGRVVTKRKDLQLIGWVYYECREPSGRVVAERNTPPNCSRYYYVMILRKYTVLGFILI